MHLAMTLILGSNGVVAALQPQLYDLAQKYETKLKNTSIHRDASILFEQITLLDLSSKCGRTWPHVFLEPWSINFTQSL